jgi:hypothetical protein
MSSPRMIVIPHWVAVANLVSFTVSLALLTWRGSAEQTRANACEQSIQRAVERYEANAAACSDQLVTCLGYSRRVVDRLDVLTKLVREGW